MTGTSLVAAALRCLWRLFVPLLRPAREFETHRQFYLIFIGFRYFAGALQGMPEPLVDPLAALRPDPDISGPTGNFGSICLLPRPHPPVGSAP